MWAFFVRFLPGLPSFGSRLRPRHSPTPLSAGNCYERGTTKQRAVQVDFVWGALFAQ